MNPETYSFCCGCPNYEPCAAYAYQLSSPAKRKCRHLQRCKRAVDVAEKSRPVEQLSIFGTSKIKS